jgi:hypothetical protein
MRAAAYDAGAPARCVASVGGSEETLFLVGTLKARGDNEVHVVAHDRDRDALDARRVFAHAHEIWDLQPHPRDAALLATLFHDPSSGRADHAGAVWRLPGGASATDRDDDAPAPAPASASASASASSPRAPLERAASFPALAGRAKCARWNPADAGVVAVVDDEHLRVLHLDAAASSLGEQGRVALEGVAAAASSALGAWDPASPRVFAVCAGPSVALFDLRASATATSSRPAVLVEAAHAGRALDLEFVRGARAEMVTCGEDGAVRAWDLRGGSGSGSGSSGGGDAGASGRARSTDESSGFPGPRGSLRSTLGRHAHWATRVAVNPTYDTLVVSASSDGAAALWSSAKAGGGGGGGGGGGEVARFAGGGGAEASIEGVAWSGGDPWSFAALERGGRLELHGVPRAHKYEILL